MVDISIRMEISSLVFHLITSVLYSEILKVFSNGEMTDDSLVNIVSNIEHVHDSGWCTYGTYDSDMSGAQLWNLAMDSNN